MNHLTPLCLALLLPGIAHAGEKPGPKKPPVFENRAALADSALAINFAKALALDLPSLATLGPRIEQGRRDADPVALVSAANELAAAEAAAGKQAALKSADLLKEAVELARLRQNPAELKVVGKLAGTAIPEPATSDDVAPARPGSFRVENRIAGASVQLYVDGHPAGTIPPNSERTFHLAATTRPATHLVARTADGRVWHRTVSNVVRDFRWVLHP